MSTELAETSNLGTGAMIEVATGRVIQEVQAAMTIAKRFPRDEPAAAERIRKACTRPRLAEQAIYQYPRGGSKVQGPSIRLAEAMAQNWGNLDYGIIELEQRLGESDVMAYCWDLETNTRQTKIFTVKHERHTRQGVTALTDPRDIYEMAANQGARRMRACVLGVIPGDIQDMAVEQCRKTLAGNSKEPIADRVRKMVAAFAEYGVSPEMIERRLGYKLDACDEHGLVGLRSIYTSLRDGMSTREDWFDVEVTAAVDSHRKQARTQRKKENPPTPEEQGASEGSQVNPAVENADGVDEPPEPTSEEEEAHIAKKIGAAKNISAVNEALELAGDGHTNPWVGPEAVERLKKKAENQRILIRSKRGPNAKNKPVE